MRQAAALLADTEQTVLEIAIGVGYGSVSQFGVAFKEHYHMAPSQYRQAMREKKSKMDGDGLKTMEAEKKM